ncbi:MULTISPECIES: hypothetical protein [Enterobacteriaceae]|uniref:hypothetical protein n=1 Tax=Enterobacteriaceae TaxID=543 RepID=UPI000A19A008|nr:MULTISPECIES: hypothetical protein [Enterobacteriaceae]ECH9260025.1 hypothetical protein [Salmonella enterica subsp. enterica]EEY9907782.1 hypothetical protein [Escherichia coli]EKV4612151.1 hypothetical protein [Citrobacter freundii]MBL9514028.1 hypothetical protein [Klebsiella pneumoniae]HDX8604864.1 hypothetical protein [Klebsiella michiganensis]
MAYGNKPYPKSPLPTGDFKSSGKKLVARKEDGIVTIYYEGTNDVYEGPAFTELSKAEEFCNNHNRQLNLE